MGVTDRKDDSTQDQGQMRNNKDSLESRGEGIGDVTVVTGVEQSFNQIFKSSNVLLEKII